MTWEQMDPLLNEMKALGEKYNVPMSAIALNWVMCKGAIPLGGARNAHQAEQVSSRPDLCACLPMDRADDVYQNAKAMTFQLTDEEVDSLSAKGADGKTSVPASCSLAPPPGLIIVAPSGSTARSSAESTADSRSYLYYYALYRYLCMHTALL